MTIFNEEAVGFCVAFAICVTLMIYTYKTKKTETMPLAFVYTFVVEAFFVILNLILKLVHTVPHSSMPFYQVSYLNFVGVMLVINLFLFRAKAKAEKAKQ